MTDPKISIIMPVYNAERFLKESIGSILSQTFKDFELLIIYDDSTDNSVEICKSFSKSDSRIKILKNYNKPGIVGALNCGLAQAKGIYIARMDSDDKSRSDRLEKQFNFLEKNRSIYLLGTAYAPFTEKGIRTIIAHPQKSLHIAWNYLFNSYFCHPSVMFRKSLVSSIGLYPEQVAEDYAYFSKVVMNWPSWNLQEPLLEYREHETNLSITRKIEMNQSVEEVSKHNFMTIFGDLNDFELLRRFVVENQMGATQAFKILAFAFNFKNKIQEIYLEAIPQYECFQFLISVFFKVNILSFRSLRRKIFAG